MLHRHIFSKNRGEPPAIVPTSKTSAATFVFGDKSQASKKIQKTSAVRDAVRAKSES
jgi:hypothetical protein